MRRLNPLSHWPVALGLAVALQSYFSESCFANGWWHHRTTVMTTTTGGVPVAGGLPVAGSPFLSAQPLPTHLVPATPILNPAGAASPVAPVAGFNPYMPVPVAPGAAASPFAPAAPAAQYAARPVSPYTHLAAFDPAAPIAPVAPLAAGTPIGQAQALTGKILSQLKNVAGTIWNDRQAIFQTAVNIFGNETGFSPAATDVLTLVKLADKVFNDLQAAKAAPGGLAPVPGGLAPVVPPAALPAGTVATVTFILTVNSNGQVNVSQPTVTPVHAPAPAPAVDPAPAPAVKPGPAVGPDLAPAPPIPPLPVPAGGEINKNGAAIDPAAK